MGKLDGKVAIVTGAGSGLGRDLALRFAAEGAKVGVLSITAANVDATVAAVRERGGEAFGATIDVTDAPAIAPTVKAVAEALGPIDILVNCAHEVSSIFSSVLDLGDAQLQRQFDIGPFAYLHFMQACHPWFKGRGGRVINFASSIGVNCKPDYAPYAMQKEAVRALTRCAAREWGADGITVNCVLPVAVTPGYEVAVAHIGQTSAGPGMPLGRAGSPYDDIAPVVAFLASEDSRYMTGYSFFADGGLSIDAAR